MLNLSEKCNYNSNLVWINTIHKDFSVCARMFFLNLILVVPRAMFCQGGYAHCCAMEVAGIVLPRRLNAFSLERGRCDTSSFWRTQTERKIAIFIDIFRDVNVQFVLYVMRPPPSQKWLNWGFWFKKMPNVLNRIENNFCDIFFWDMVEFVLKILRIQLFWPK